MRAGSGTGLDRAREPGDSSDSLSGASHVLVSCERGRRRESSELTVPTQQLRTARSSAVCEKTG